MQYSEALGWLESLIPMQSAQIFPGGIGVRRVRRMLDLLGAPDHKFTILHVAGTSGKGSVVHLAAAILTGQGLRVGRQVSPHLQDIRERIVVDNCLISEQDFANLASQVELILAQIEAEFTSPATYFEVLVVMGCLYFAQQHVDCAVIETGLGGLYDGTNALSSLITAITHIDYDHTHILGNTLAQIAQQKAGIMKPENVVVILGRQDREPWQVLKHAANKLNLSVSSLGEDYVATIISHDQHGLNLNYHDKKHCLDNINISLLGRHQVDNLAVALRISLEYLQYLGRALDRAALYQNLKQIKLSGRLELVKHAQHTWLLDGAHNPDKCRALARALAELWPHQRKVCLLAFKKNKDIAECLRIFQGQCDIVITTEFGVATRIAHLCLPALELQQLCAQQGLISVAQPNLAKAIHQAEEFASKKDVILTSGSIYLVGEVGQLIDL